jgi:hypothetical protein
MRVLEPYKLAVYREKYYDYFLSPETFFHLNRCGEAK